MLLLAVGAEPLCPEDLPESGGDPPLMGVNAGGRVLMACGALESPGQVYAAAFVRDGKTVWQDGQNRITEVRVEGKSIVSSDGLVETVLTAAGVTARCAPVHREPPSPRVAKLLAQPKLAEPQDDREQFVSDVLEAALRGHAPSAAIVDRWDTGPPGEGDITETADENKRVLAAVRKLHCKPYGARVPPKMK